MHISKFIYNLQTTSRSEVMLIFYNIVSEVIQVLRPVTMLLPYREREREQFNSE
ncbi:MAG: hypothetical protein CH6_3259 [Candidatus Kapaibacterium sp.]|nr:MAG: hypothetical protein CH6_3259 [Candidatus Kapabacteria bacterium]